MYQGPKYQREVNPRENASILSVLFFTFTRKILIKGIKKELQEEDIYDILKDYKSSELGDKFEKEWSKEAVKKKPSFSRVIWRLYGRRYFIVGAIKLVFRTFFMVSKPLATGKLVRYFNDSGQMSRSDAYYYAALLISAVLIYTLVVHTYMLYILTLAQKVRIGVCSLIYRKSLKLSTSSITEITNGRIVTLMAKDVMCFDAAVHFTNDIWIGIIQVLILIYVIYGQIGSAAFVGVGLLLVISPLQMLIAKLTIKIKLKALAKSDERVRLIQEILSTIQIIKIYTWENYFSRLVAYVRKREIEKIKLMYYMKAVILSLGHLSSRISFYVCMIVYAFMYDSITAEKAFTVLSCYGSMQYTLNVAIPLGVSQLAETKSSLKRIKELLLTKEVDEIQKEHNDVPTIQIKDLAVEITEGKQVLHDINLDLKPGLYGITGSVGSGKSMLLKALLKDLNITEGSINLDGSMSYASQEPWLFPGTIRQNILFGLPYEANRYQTVINICGLRRDLDIFSKGDNTLVSDRGLNLSKGQQARVNLARAIYKKADIYLLDNPLAALDATVSKLVFNNCIKDFLGKKLCLLVAHQIQFLKEVDSIIVMKDGTIENQGSFNELERSGVTFGSDFVEDNAKGEAAPEQNYLKTIDFDKDEETDEKSALIQKDLEMEATKLYTETQKEGKVEFEIYKKYFNYAGGFKTVPFLILLGLIMQISSSGFDYYISYWINVEDKITYMQNNGTTNTTYYEELLDTKQKIPLIYTLLIIGTTLLSFSNSFATFFMTGFINKKLHHASFSKILTAPMAFFDQNLSGNILNRFSKDVSIIDEELPFLVFQCLRIVLLVMGVLSIVATIKLGFLFVTLALGVVLYCLRLCYIPTSRSLKRLDGMTRSPVIGHLNASLEGLPTIRASGVEEILKIQFDKHQDLHSSAAYMFIMTNRAFGFCLDMLSSFYTCTMVLTFLFISVSSAGNVGLAITQSFSLSGILQYGMRQWALLENQMTSVERILEYSDIKPEVKAGQKPKGWPSEGRLEYKNVRLRYPKTNELVLKDITFSVESKEKVGIIGRTGAGKTSIISSLFRLYNVEEGQITVDDRDVKGIDLDDVRSKISIIPQNPILFSGTVRSNLDPYNEFSDKELWRALEAVEMKAIVTNMEMQLDCEIKEGGSNFSAGQKQLVCLARAVLRNNKIIVLDEATANIDPQTDALIQITIKKQFSDCTILTIAHRLNTILNSDKVMVVDNGMITEYDKPETLLNDKESAFYYLVSQAGLLKNNILKL